MKNIKIRGFKVKICTTFKELQSINIKRKQITLWFFEGVYRAYSFHDDGYKVSTLNVNKDDAINDCIDKALTKIKSFNGLPVTERTYPDKVYSGKIIWWIKGSTNDLIGTHYKAETFYDGYPVEGVGDTLEEALIDLKLTIENIRD